MSVTADHPGEPASVFSPLAVLGLILAAICAAAAFAVLSAYAPQLRTGGGGASAQSLSATGYAGVVRLMRLTGWPMEVSSDPQVRLGSPGLVILTPTRPLSPEDLRSSAPRLVILPKWTTAPDDDHPGWVLRAGAIPPVLAAQIIPPKVGAFTLTRDTGPPRPVTLHSSGPVWPQEKITTGPISDLQTGSGANLWPIITDDKNRILVGVMPDGHTYVLTDPDLLNTQGMRDVETARAAVTLLTALRGTGPVPIFDVTLNGIQGGRSLLRLALEPPFLGATLCLLAAAGLVGLQGWNRFGPALRTERAVALGKTALAENGAAMVRLARRESRMALRYVRLCRERAAHALGAEHLDAETLDDFLDRWAQRVGAEDRITALLAQAMKVTKTSDVAPLAQRARRWRLEMTREPG